MEKRNEILASALKEKRNLLEHEAMELLRSYDIPAPAFRLAKSKEEALRAAADIGYPAVFKIVSKDIIHKSDAGCVRVGIQTPLQAEEAYEEIVGNARAYDENAVLEGVLVVEQAGKGLECIIGMTRDEQFGPALMFGLGGVLVELFEDVTLELLPVTEREAAAMLGRIKGGRLLAGYRGDAPKDQAALTDILLKLAALTEECPQIREIDLNPVLVYEQGAVVLDARMLL